MSSGWLSLPASFNGEVAANWAASFSRSPTMIGMPYRSVTSLRSLQLMVYINSISVTPTQMMPQRSHSASTIKPMTLASPPALVPVRQGLGLDPWSRPRETTGRSRFRVVEIDHCRLSIRLRSHEHRGGVRAIAAVDVIDRSRQQSVDFLLNFLEGRLEPMRAARIGQVMNAQQLALRAEHEAAGEVITRRRHDDFACKGVLREIEAHQRTVFRGFCPRRHEIKSVLRVYRQQRWNGVCVSVVFLDRSPGGVCHALPIEHRLAVTPGQ